MPIPMRVIPVLDLKAGRAVHAVAGDRAHYRPVRSVLHTSFDPIGLAGAFRDQLGLRELYLADLDAITGRAAPAYRLYDDLRALGLRLWVDAGVREPADLPALIAAQASVVVGLETVRGPEALGEVVAAAGASRLILSLDLDAGRPRFAAGADWGTSDAHEVAERAFALGVRRFLLLDLARVGTGSGTGTTALLARLAVSFRGRGEAELAVGGGIANATDLPRLACAGASAVLVGTALHTGAIGPAELGRLG